MRLIGPAAALSVLALFFGISEFGAPASAQRFDGQEIFRFDTFGDEQLWTDTLRLHEALETVTPAAALGLGLKVDVDALPPPVVKAIQSNALDVKDPKVTRQLLEMNAVVGVIGKVTGDRITSVGVTCALCHSTVDDSLAKGIGHRLDGWPNLTLDVGKIAALAPGLPAALKPEFSAWGPGKYDPRHHIFDGAKLAVLNTPSKPVVIPPAYGLDGVAFETFNGDGPVSYWNAYVGITQMGGKGNFSDPRIGVNVEQRPDRVTAKLPALLAYQLSLKKPPPPAGTFDPIAAKRGSAIFTGAGRCSSCHVAPTYTDVNRGTNPQIPLLHAPSEVGTDPQYAARSATKMYRTTPLRALWQYPPYFHDGSAADLLAVVNHYDKLFGLALTEPQKADLVAFLKSL